MTDKLWIPINGETVWIKVFSNWSKGTYIGLDSDRETHLVREPKEGGGAILSAKVVLPEWTNPNDKISKSLQNEFLITSDLANRVRDYMVLLRQAIYAPTHIKTKAMEILDGFGTPLVEFEKLIGYKS